MQTRTNASNLAANSEELCEQSASEFESAWSYLGIEILEYFDFGVTAN